jgi:hypothetical protein
VIAYNEIPTDLQIEQGAMLDWPQVFGNESPEQLTSSNEMGAGQRVAEAAA